MRESRSYGSVGAWAVNRPFYPESKKLFRLKAIRLKVGKRKIGHGPTGALTLDTQSPGSVSSF